MPGEVITANTTPGTPTSGQVESKWQKVQRPVAIVAALVVVLLAIRLTRDVALHALSLSVQPLDEPLQLVGGMFIRLGQKPLVDFRSVYPPLNYYIVAGLFQIVGESVLAFRFYQVACFGGLVALVGLYTFVLGGGALRIAVACLATTFVASGAVHTMTLPAAVMAVAALISYSTATHALTTRRRNVLFFGCGLALTVATGIRLNFGMYVCAALGVDWFLEQIYPRRRGGADIDWQGALCLLLPLLLGLLWFGIVWHGHLLDVLNQFVFDTSHVIKSYAFKTPLDVSTWAGITRALRQGFFLPILPGLLMAARTAQRTPAGNRGLLPVVLCLGSAVFVGLLVSWLAPSRPERLPLVVLAVVLPLLAVTAVFPRLERREVTPLFAFAFATHYFLSRPDLPHAAGLLPLVALLLPNAIPMGFRLRDLAPPAALIMLMAPYLLAEKAMIYSGSIDVGREMLDAAGLLLRLGDARATETNAHPLIHRLYQDGDEKRVILSLRAHTQPDEAVFIGLGNHRRTIISDVRAYWLARRRTGVPDVLMMNGLTTTPAAERRIRRALNDRNVNWVVLWNVGGEDPAWGNLVRDSDGSLDAFVDQTFVQRARFGAYDLRQRN